MAMTLSRLDEEFASMERLLVASPKGKLNHRIELPYGVLTLLVRRASAVEDPKRSSELTIRPGSENAEITTSDQLLRNAIRNLTPEQMSQISAKATEEALKIQTEAVRADQRFQNASRDIDSFIDGTRRLESQNVDFKQSGTFNTASGTTSINVRKDQSKTWIIVAVALAILVLLLILSRR